MKSFRLETLVSAAHCLLLAGSLAGCATVDGAHDEESLRTRLDAVTGNLTISGQIVDANGAPKPGVRVALNGSVQRTATTNASGNYAFSGLASVFTLPTSSGFGFQNIGDPEVAVGAPDAAGHQAFYYSTLSRVAVGSPTVAGAALFISTDEGASFVPAGTPYPVDCSTAAASCILPDQPMLTADRVNRATAPSGQTFDQLYLAWRNVQLNTAGAAAGTFSFSLSLACSADGGTTWRVDSTSLTGSNRGDFPRLDVAPDGSLLVAYADYSSRKDYGLKLARFSSCASGFQLVAGFPVTRFTNRDPASMAGMARQPGANYSIAADRADATGNSVFLAYAAEYTEGSENIFVAHSTDGGLTFGNSTVVNSTPAGHRYFPSICSTNGVAHVSWFDRRAGTVSGASPDLTGYYRAALVPSSLIPGQMAVTAEFNVSGAGFEDPQCLTGFPGQKGATTSAAETLCTNLPNVNFGIGTCQGACAAGVTGPCGSQVDCDFRAGSPGANVCPMGEACALRGGFIAPGVPKYGDYVMADCAQGRIFTAWASGKAPALACEVNGGGCAVGADCCSGTCTGGFCGVPGLTTCLGTGITGCSANSDCCSLTCQGGMCMAPTQVYTQSTSCIGDFPADLTCVSSQDPGGPAFYVSFSAEKETLGQHYPFDICGNGTGFTPGGGVAVTYTHPAYGAPVTHSAGTADASGNFSFADTLFPRPGNCTYQEYMDGFGGAEVVFTDVSTGRTFQAPDTIPNCFVCEFYVDENNHLITPSCGTQLNGGCP